MSLAFQEDSKVPEYATKTEIHYMLHVPYYKIGEAVKTGKLGLYLIDNKIQINIAEAKAVFGK
jgi:hypothetical protein